MALIEIPMNSVPNQEILIRVSGIACTVTLRNFSTGLYFSLVANGAALCENVLCVDRSPLLRAAYMGFPGDFCFIDTVGQDAPEVWGLDARWRLVYSAGGFGLI